MVKSKWESVQLILKHIKMVLYYQNKKLKEQQFKSESEFENIINYYFGAFSPNDFLYDSFKKFGKSFKYFK